MLCICSFLLQKSRGDAVSPWIRFRFRRNRKRYPPLVRTADEVAPPRREQRNKSPAELDFYREFYAAHCGAPVLPVPASPVCGRKLRPKGAKKARRRRAVCALCALSPAAFCLRQNRQDRRSAERRIKIPVKVQLRRTFTPLPAPRRRGRPCRAGARGVSFSVSPEPKTYPGGDSVPPGIRVSE